MHDITFRTMLQKDFDAVLAMEELCFSSPWDQPAIDELLRVHDATAVVAVEGFPKHERVVGYTFYRVPLPRTELLRIAVHPYRRRCGIGRALIKRLQDQLRVSGRHALEARVPEVNLPAQLFFRACGLTARGLRERKSLNPKILFRYSLREREVSKGDEVLRSIMQGDSRVVTW